MERHLLVRSEYGGKIDFKLRTAKFGEASVFYKEEEFAAEKARKRLK